MSFSPVSPLPASARLRLHGRRVAAGDVIVSLDARAHTHTHTAEEGVAVGEGVRTHIVTEAEAAAGFFFFIYFEFALTFFFLLWPRRLALRCRHLQHLRRAYTTSFQRRPNDLAPL
jgi:hypothetical protein